MHFDDDFEAYATFKTNDPEDPINPLTSALQAPPNWHEIIFERDFFKTVDRLCEQRLYDLYAQEAASNYVIIELAKNRFERLKGFAGKSAPSTYLYRICKNLVEEYARKHYGRLRPPSWVKSQGAHWIALWRELVLTKRTPYEIKLRYLEQARLCDNKQSAAANDPETFEHLSELEAAIKEMKARLPWHKYQTPTQTTLSPSLEIQEPQPNSPYREDTQPISYKSLSMESPETLYQQQELRSLEQIIYQLVMVPTDDSEIDPTHKMNHCIRSGGCAACVRELRAELGLSALALQLLGLRYCHNLSIAVIQKRVGLSRKQIDKLMTQSVTRIRAVLALNGFSACIDGAV